MKLFRPLNEILAVADRMLRRPSTPPLTILKDSEIFSAEGIAKIEEQKTAVFVCDTCLRHRDGGWVNRSAAVFWNKDPANIPKGGSPWFGMFYESGLMESGNLMITNAISTVQTPDGVPVTITGVVAMNGDVIYSRYRHDYRTSPDETAMVDGGRDYLHTGPVGLGTVELRIIDGELRVVGSLFPHGGKS